jgi:hypothetical protein
MRLSMRQRGVSHGGGFWLRMPEGGAGRKGGAANRTTAAGGGEEQGPGSECSSRPISLEVGMGASSPHLQPPSSSSSPSPECSAAARAVHAHTTPATKNVSTSSDAPSPPPLPRVSPPRVGSLPKAQIHPVAPYNRSHARWRGGASAPGGSVHLSASTSAPALLGLPAVSMPLPPSEAGRASGDDDGGGGVRLRVDAPAAPVREARVGIRHVGSPKAVGEPIHTFQAPRPRHAEGVWRGDDSSWEADCAAHFLHRKLRPQLRAKAAAAAAVAADDAMAAAATAAAAAEVAAELEQPPGRSSQQTSRSAALTTSSLVASARRIDASVGRLSSRHPRVRRGDRGQALRQAIGHASSGLALSASSSPTCSPTLPTLPSHALRPEATPASPLRASASLPALRRQQQPAPSLTPPRMGPHLVERLGPRKSPSLADLGRLPIDRAVDCLVATRRPNAPPNEHSLAAHQKKFVRQPAPPADATSLIAALPASWSSLVRTC